MIKSKEALARPGASLSKEVHMAKNDYHVIVYYILSYLYHCLKMGETPQIETLSLLDYPAEIPESYGNFIYMELSRQGFISGAVWGQVPVAGKRSDYGGRHRLSGKQQYHGQDLGKTERRRRAAPADHRGIPLIKSLL